MCHLTFHTENGKRVAEVTSLLAEMGNKTVSQPGRDVNRLKNKHDVADEDAFEDPPPQVREKRGRHWWVATRPALVKMWLDG